MAGKQSKADTLRAMREANYSAKSSDGGVVARARHADTRSRGIIARETPEAGQPQASLCRVSDKPAAAVTGGEKMKGLVGANSDRIGNGAPSRSGGFESPLDGVATIPSETKNKRAPRGTFDRAAYQRDYMRKRRASGKVDKYDRLAK